LLSQIGAPIDKPKAASVQLLMKDSRKFKKVKEKCESIVDSELAEIEKITERVMEGELACF
ncbi:MAG: methionine adenosyltransferase, partial [Candidatus Hydrothermarchaeaceae archaeon]